MQKNSMVTELTITKKCKIEDLVEKAFRSLREKPIVLIRGLYEFSEGQQLDLARGKTRKLLAWEFGEVMHVKAFNDAKNYLFSTEEVPLHWDGAFHQSPYALVFYCLSAPSFSEGGETRFCDTQRALSALEADRLQDWKSKRFRYSTLKQAHYGGSIEQDLVEFHPYSKQPVMRFAEAVPSQKNPVYVEAVGKSSAKDIEEISDYLKRPDFNYYHSWQSGDLLIADNFRLLHGRKAFNNPAHRHLRRVQVLSQGE